MIALILAFKQDAIAPTHVHSIGRGGMQKTRNRAYGANVGKGDYALNIRMIPKRPEQIGVYPKNLSIGNGCAITLNQ